MAIKDLLIEINADVKDILRMDFELTKTQSDYVPNHEDPGLTFESGKTKRAKTIETCVLYADIRNSTTLSRTKPKEMMARLYTAFTKSVLNIAEYHGGVVRNIIGDRVMVLFPEKNCFENAVDTAISINTVANRIINKHFIGYDFKCGIGIDYGEKLVIKAGIPKQDKERANYKNLIWISNSANIASKLTDIANKEIKQTIFKVTYNPYNWGGNLLPLGIYNIYRPANSGQIYQDKVAIDTLTETEFAEKLSWNDTLGVCYSGGKFLKFSKEETKTIEKPILMSDKVFAVYKHQFPQKNDIVNNFWTEQKVKIKDFSGKIYGGDVYWLPADEITF